MFDIVGGGEFFSVMYTCIHILAHALCKAK